MLAGSASSACLLHSATAQRCMAATNLIGPMQEVQTYKVQDHPPAAQENSLQRQSSEAGVQASEPATAEVSGQACHRQLVDAVATAEVLGAQLQQAWRQTSQTTAAHVACQAELAACAAHMLADRAALSQQTKTNSAAAPGQDIASYQHMLVACQLEVAACHQQLQGSQARVAAAEREAAAAHQQLQACQEAGADLHQHVRQMEASYTAACQALQAQRHECSTACASSATEYQDAELQSRCGPEAAAADTRSWKASTAQASA